MASRVQWRRFAFFDRDIVHENIFTSLTGSLTCAVADGGMLLFGDENGFCIMSDRNYNVLWKSKLFKGALRGVAYFYENSNNRKQYIVAIGDDASKSSGDTRHLQYDNSLEQYYVIKIFSTNDLIRPIQAFQANINCPIGAILTAFSVLHDGTQIALGFSTGTILLFVGTFLKEGTTSSKQQSPIVLLAADKYPVSGLHFCELQLPTTATTATATSMKFQTEKQIRLFCVLDTNDTKTTTTPNQEATTTTTTAASIGGIFVFTTYPLPSSNSSVTSSLITPSLTSTSSSSTSKLSIVSHILDERGAAVNCSTLVQDTLELVVARPEGLFSFSVEDRGGAAGLEGNKQYLCSLSKYLLVVGQEEKSNRNVITAYDLRNKLIGLSHNLPLQENILFMLRDNNVSFVITNTGTLLRLKEKNTHAKLEVLLRKSLFPLAITLAAEEQMNPTEIMKLYKMYGDYLYEKGDYSGAMVQYKVTVGVLMSSYVIRKYLDTQRLSDLVSYLETLLEKGVASEEHVILLLGCYARTQDDTKMESFCVAEEAEGRSDRTSTAVAAVGGGGAVVGGGSGGLIGIRPAFSVSAIQDILLSSGYRDYALRLALAHGDHLTYLDIQLTNHPPTDNELETSLAYLAALTVKLKKDVFFLLLQKVGKVFLSHLPGPFIALLVRLSLGLLPPNVDAPSIGNFEPMKLSVDSVMSLFLHQDIQVTTPLLMEYLEIVFREGGGSLLSPAAADTLLELRLEKYSIMNNNNNNNNNIKKTVVPSVQYIDHREEDENDLNHSNNTVSSKENEDSLESLKNEILSMLRDSTVTYSPEQALLNTSIYGFSAGEAYLLEKRLQSPSLLLQKLLDAKGKDNDAALFQLLQKEGRHDSSLYVTALSYYLNSNNTKKTGNHRIDQSNRFKCITELLQMLTERWVAHPPLTQKYPSPMQILHMLTTASTHTDLPLDVAKEFIKMNILQLSEEEKQLEKDVEVLSSIIQPLRLVVSKDQEEMEIISTEKKDQIIVTSTATGNSNTKTKTTTNPFEDDNDDEEEEDQDNSSTNRRSGNTTTTTTSHRQNIAGDDNKANNSAKLQQQQQQKKWESIRKAQAERAADHETFFAEIESSADGFSTAASYFGKILVS